MGRKPAGQSTQGASGLETTQPRRGADRNQDALRDGHDVDESVALPSLDVGITLFDIEGGRGVSALQSLVLDHLLLNDGPAFWVDANGNATTTTLSRIAPSQRLLDRIHVARGFTACQHYGAVCDLPTAVNRSIRESATDDSLRTRQRPTRDGTSPQTPSIIVAPAVDVQYCTDDTLAETHAETLHARTLARLATYADGYDIPVLVTRSERSAFTDSVVEATDHHLECEHTRLGPRFVGEDFETLVYTVADGAYYQTTFTYWQQLLEARATQVGVEPETTSPSTRTPDGIGTGVTADGERTSVAATPLLDAWRDTGAGGK